MSHFTDVEVDFDQKNEKELIAALEKQFGEGSVEFNPQGSPLYGYQGDNRAKASKSSPDYAPPCEIVVRRRFVGSASNDVGYRRLENGKYTAYVSDYDKSGPFNQTRQGIVSQEYALRVAEKQLKAQGWTTKRVEKEHGYVTVTTTGRSFKF